MKYISSDLWSAFNAFAKSHPNDAGNCMRQELADWVAEHQPELSVSSIPRRNLQALRLPVLAPHAVVIPRHGPPPPPTAA